MPDRYLRNERWLTWPNLVTSLRILGCPGLVFLAIADRPVWVAVLAVALVATEWLDGFLARRLHQHSTTGARLDTVADALFYASLLLAVIIVSPLVIAREAVWIAAAVGSYALSWIASALKFRRLPSYHTWAAKAVWVLVGTGIVCLLAQWTAWPFRIAMVCVVAANVEAMAITLVLQQCEVNVASIFHVVRSAATRTEPVERD